jgi:hypothetical protein
MGKVKLSNINKYICIHPIYLDKIYKQGSIVIINNVAQAMDLLQKKLIKRFEEELQKVSEDVVKEKLEIDNLRELYTKQFGKAVPNRYKNNVEWIKSKI